MSYIGIDIGGTNTKLGLVSNDGVVLSKNSLVTNKDFSAMIDALTSACKEFIKESKDKVLGIGIGCPGLINSSSGVVEYSCNIGWEGVSLKEALENKLNIEVRLSNDANVATLGETIYGAGVGHSNVIMLTLGTGVGGGIVVNKHIYDGNHGAGAELGHMVISMDGKKCSCGMCGCLETYASAKAFLKDTKEAMMLDSSSLMWQECGGDISKVNIFTAFNCATDKTAKNVVDNYIKYLGIGVLNYCNIFRPEVVILGGGMSHVGKPLLEKLEHYIKKNNYGYKRSPKVDIKLATLENDAGIVGGRALFME